MSNFLAIATVTLTLSQLLQKAVGNDVPGSTITTLRPDDNAHGTPTTGVNIFLYQVTHNAAWRNEDLPSRRSSGELVQRPRAAMDLHYLFTFYGDETQLEPQRLLGSVARAIHSQPVLTRKQVHDTVTGGPAYLNHSNLYDDIETVKFTPLPLSLEELSKLWSVFFQTQYALSVAYMGSAVLIESEDAPQAALPVLAPKVFTSILRFPSITTIEPQMIEFNPTAQVTISGNSLRASSPNTTVVLFNGLEGSLAPTSQPNSLTVTLPAGAQAGVNEVRVIHNQPLGTTTLRSAESNSAALIIQPKLNSITFGNFGTPPGPAFRIDVTPSVSVEQRVMLLLNQVANPAPLAFTLPAEHRDKATDPIIFDARKVPAGTYLVRVRVDGADSNLTIDTMTKKFNGPTVVRP